MKKAISCCLILMMLLSLLAGCSQNTEQIDTVTSTYASEVSVHSS